MINMIDYFDFWYKFYKFLFGVYSPIIKQDDSEYLKRRINLLTERLDKLENNFYS
jgi:hypothetical protein